MRYTSLCDLNARFCHFPSTAQPNTSAQLRNSSQIIEIMRNAVHRVLNPSAYAALVQNATAQSQKSQSDPKKDAQKINIGQ